MSQAKDSLPSTGFSPGDPRKSGLAGQEGSSTGFSPGDPRKSGLAGQEGSSTGFAPGTQLGRFTVLGVLGQGGMGVVLAAFDPTLQRKVALKLLRPAVWSDGSVGEGRDRLLREARAMAQLSHANVVAVHDVGTVGDQIFVAMELAAGGTLRQWLEAGPRPWPEVIERFVAAGRGLAAAHEAGLVHRDFKPDNVLLGAGGQVRVADFGLVGVEPGGGPALAGDGGDGGGALTESGAFVGTPGYMAPEQHRGERAGPEADQFAFSVALWDALYRQRPYPGANAHEIFASIRRGELRPTPPGSPVPARVAAILRRGLALEPARRWPSMGAMLDALAAVPRPRRLWIMAAVAAVVLGAAAVAGFAARRPTLCRGFEAKLAGVWDPRRREAILRAFLATGRPYAADTFQRATGLLDAYAAAWVRARADACEATHVRGEQSPALLDRRMRCLDGRLGELDGLGRLFARAPDVAVLDGAIEAAAGLRRLDRCADAAALEGEPPPPSDPALAAKVLALGRRLTDVRMLEASGKLGDALPLARAVVDEARAAGHAPTLAAGLYALGILLHDTGDARAAEPVLRDSAETASLVRDRDTAALAWIALLSLAGEDAARAADLTGLRAAAERAVVEADRPPGLVTLLDSVLGNAAGTQGHPDEAERRHRQALALRERTLGPDDLDVAVSLNNLAVALETQGKLDEAVADHERALAIRERILGPEHPHIAVTLNNLGVAFLDRGDYPRAERTLERALAIRVRDLGPDHPEVAGNLANLGSVYQGQGRYADAERLARRAVAIREKVFGPEHPLVAGALNNLANALSAQGKLDETLRLHQRAVAIREKVLGDRHPETAESYNNIGDTLFALERFAEAGASYQRALDVWRAAYGAGHPYVGIAILNLGGVDDALGRHAPSLARFEEARALLEKALGPGHPLVTTAMTGVATARLNLGQAREALALGEEVLARREKQGTPLEVADARFIVARALWRTGGDRRRARDLATRARPAFAEAGVAMRRQLGEIDDWLAKHH